MNKTRMPANKNNFLINGSWACPNGVYFLFMECPE